MKTLLIIVLNGWVPVVLPLQPAPPTLHLIKQALTWADARTYCKATYTDLAPVKTYDDVLKISDEAARQGVTWAIWVGLYNDINSWRWSFHELSLSALTFQNWATLEPNNNKGIEQCGRLNSLGSWSDNTCSTPLPFICYNARYLGDGRFVGVSSPKLNWTDAQAYCRRFHTDLATALDTTDNGILQQVASLQGNSWFGLYRDGWTGINHTKALNISWTAGQPDNYYGKENCGRFVAGLLDDMSCMNKHYFFCHYTPPIKRKILKFHVRSDQNVMGAAVQSSILAKIMKKLEEHGMLEDITATWRVQPDGNIFHKNK